MLLSQSERSCTLKRSLKHKLRAAIFRRQCLYKNQAVNPLCSRKWALLFLWTTFNLFDYIATHSRVKLDTNECVYLWIYVSMNIFNYKEKYIIKYLIIQLYPRTSITYLGRTGIDIREKTKRVILSWPHFYSWMSCRT